MSFALFICALSLFSVIGESKTVPLLQSRGDLLRGVQVQALGLDISELNAALRLRHVEMSAVFAKNSIQKGDQLTIKNSIRGRDPALNGLK